MEIASHASSPQHLSPKDLDALIRPIAFARYEVDIPMNHIESTLAGYARDWESLDLTPDYQRGHVWTQSQQTYFIENLLRGVVTSAGLLIQWNCPNWEDDKYSGELPRGMQCIDGLQRLSAMREYLAGRILPFGLHIKDLEGSRYSMKRNRWSMRFAVYNFATRAELLQHYLDINGAGTPHSRQELDRVRLLREQSLQESLASA
jgi:hypothetical protein